MQLWLRRAIKTVVGIGLLILVSSMLYHGVMIVFEGESPTYAHSLQVVVETYSGTGYGSDSPWNSTVANAFVTVMDLSTFLILFIVVPYVFRPVLEEALSPTVPTNTDLTDHVVICGVEQQGERLIDEFEAQGVDYVVIVDSEDKAIELSEREKSVVYGEPSSTETLQNAGLEFATNVIVDVTDDQSASVVLAIDEINDQVQTVVLVRDMDLKTHLEYAGADRVLTPRQLLGERIAERISTVLSPRLSDSVTLGKDYSILELSVFEDAPICGRTIEAVESEVSITIHGVWTEGTFDDSPDPDDVIDGEMSLLIAGPSSRLRELETSMYEVRETEPFVIVAGYGIVGSTARENLRQAATPVACTVIDVEDLEGVDIVGDATREETLREAGIEEASAFVVTIASDEDAILSVLAANELNGDIDIIVRVNHSENRTKIRRAGADYVLSLPEISGRILALQVLHEEILSYDRQLKILRSDVSAYAGRPLGETSIAESAGIIVGLERGGSLRTDLTMDFRIEDGDSVLVAGTDEMLEAVKG